MKNISDLIIEACNKDLNFIEQNDQCYVNDCLAVQEAEEAYKKLSLTDGQREVIDQYIAFLELSLNSKARLYYKAGIDHAVAMIKYIEII